jgi:hypothetical protein
LNLLEAINTRFISTVQFVQVFQTFRESKVLSFGRLAQRPESVKGSGYGKMLMNRLIMFLGHSHPYFKLQKKGISLVLCHLPWGFMSNTPTVAAALALRNPDRQSSPGQKPLDYDPCARLLHIKCPIPFCDAMGSLCGASASHGTNNLLERKRAETRHHHKIYRCYLRGSVGHLETVYP